MCLIGAGIGLAMWVMFDSPMSALLICLFMNFLGTLPTIRKVYYQPETENGLAWTLFSLGTLLNLFAIEEWSFSMAVYPVSMIFIVGTVTVLVLIPSRARRNDGQEAI
jgi:ABC-type transport system involved in cytochrome c biogenesis permease subunit